MPYKDKELNRLCRIRMRARNRQKYRDRCKQYRRKHPEYKITGRLYKKNHPEIVLACRKRHYAKHRDRILAQKREWYKKNKKRHYEVHKLWIAKNPEKMRSIRRSNNQLRRVLKRNALIGDLYAIQAWQDAWKSNSKTICRWCNKETDSRFAEVDHILPISRGGAHTLENLCISCRTCNRRKHKKTLEEWMK